MVGQLHEAGCGHGCQTLRRTAGEPTATGGQKSFLIHGLIGTTSLQALGTISRQQQQGHGAVVGLHHRGQQIGHSGAGRGHNRSRQTIRPAEPQGKKSSRALIHRREQLQAPRLQEPSGDRKRSGATTRAEHQPAQASGPQGLQQV